MCHGLSLKMSISHPKYVSNFLLSDTSEIMARGDYGYQDEGRWPFNSHKIYKELTIICSCIEYKGWLLPLIKVK